MKTIILTSLTTAIVTSMYNSLSSGSKMLLIVGVIWSAFIYFINVFLHLNEEKYKKKYPNSPKNYWKEPLLIRFAMWCIPPFFFLIFLFFEPDMFKKTFERIFGLKSLQFRSPFKSIEFQNPIVVEK